ncbi:comEA protein [Thermodesulforhabdus norvegica]|uniref:ComEA protein n=1 Tax=Thermodesulforhabdus norvegica TaxID=39841 RepID=A0A1I4UR33_9BACT|nr:helix-hairpin-helix domain-containing protein [Thermodesulforhabdus norvegica]SFM91378.1 comEA protein [Thermodesulforhabdus norvegica]
MKKYSIILLLAFTLLLYAVMPCAAQNQPTNQQTASEQVSAKININTADKADLEKLPGIGPALAERIIQYRQEHGPFKTIDELKNVKGIGDKKFEAIKDLITVE